MKIRWNGHSSFTITAADGTTIVTDPYQPGAFGGGIGYRQIDVQPDIVTISHEHDDHNYLDGFSGDFAVLRQTGRAKGIAFTAVDTFHDESGGSKRGTNRIFAFTVDGVRLCHLGDLGHLLTDEQIAAIGKVDVLFVPVGGFYTIDAHQATDAMRRLDPRVVIPMHFKTDKCGFPITPVSTFTNGKDRVQMLDAVEIELTADALPGTTEIFVLNHYF